MKTKSTTHQSVYQIVTDPNKTNTSKRTAIDFSQNIDTLNRNQVSNSNYRDIFIAGHISESTSRAYKADLRAFFCRFGTNTGSTEEPVTLEIIQSVTVQDVIRWRNELIESGLASSTVNRKLSAIRSFFDFLAALGVIKRSPAEPKLVRGLKTSQSSTTNALNVEEIRSILQTIDKIKDPVMRLRDRALVLLLVYGGLRRSEVVNVKQEDIIMKDSHWVLNIPESKGGLNQWVKLQPVVVESIQHYLDALGTIRNIIIPKNEPIFIGFGNQQKGQIKPLSPHAVNRIVQRHCKRAGIEKSISAHSLRHSCASLAIAAGAPPTKVMAHLRHKSITTTMRYVHDRDALTSNASDFIKL